MRQTAQSNNVEFSRSRVSIPKTPRTVSIGLLSVPRAHWSQSNRNLFHTESPPAQSSKTLNYVATPETRSYAQSQSPPIKGEVSTRASFDFAKTLSNIFAPFTQTSSPEEKSLRKNERSKKKNGCSLDHQSLSDRVQKDSCDSLKEVKIDKQMLTCNICYDLYDQKLKKPKILPMCGHILCECCLRKNFEMNYEKRVVTCHLCKKNSDLKVYQCVSDFPNSWVTLDLLERITKSIDIAPEKPQVQVETLEEKIMCRFCKEENPVSQYCRNHFKKFCAYCALTHIRDGCQSEKIIDIQELEDIKCNVTDCAVKMENKINEEVSELNKKKALITTAINSHIDSIVEKLNEKRHEILSAISYRFLEVTQVQEEFKKINAEVRKSKINLAESSLLGLPDVDLKLRNLCLCINKLETSMKNYDTTTLSTNNLADKLKLRIDDAEIKRIHSSIETVFKLENPTNPQISIDYKQALFDSCQIGSLEMVKFVMENACTDKSKDLVEEKDKNGLTPFFTAYINRKFTICQYLEDNFNCNINVQDNTGKTPLIHSVLTGDLQAIDYLVRKCKADVNLHTIWQDTALHCAVECGRVDIVKLLIEQGGARLDSRNKFGKKPIDLAKNEEMRAYLNSKA